MSEPGSSALVVPVSPLRMRLLHLTTGSMLATIVLLSIFFVFDPPLDFQDFLRILQQVLPIFIGFLLSAISYATGNQPAGAIEKERFGILKKVLDSAFLFYWIGVFLLTLLFAYSHSRFAVAGKAWVKTFFSVFSHYC